LGQRVRDLWELRGGGVNPEAPIDDWMTVNQSLESGQ